MKTCTKCGVAKKLAKFSKNKRTKDGRASWCMDCRVEQQRRYRKVGKLPRPAYLDATECAVCDRPPITRGFCTRHYAKVKKYGDPLYVAPPRPRSPLTYDQRMLRDDPERWHDMKRQAHVKRQRLLAGARSEPYARLDIFNRDGWICGICEEPIDPAIKGRKSGAASLDHIIPISLGGDDTPENVQAAHFGCNSGKCNRVDEALLAAAG
jgi:5-methylcytosine-specific restriction endonuclease McrA